MFSLCHSELTLFTEEVCDVHVSQFLGPTAAACQARAGKHNTPLAFRTERPPAAICLCAVLICTFHHMLLLITLCVVSNVSVPCLLFFTLRCLLTDVPSWLLGSGCCFHLQPHRLSCRVLARRAKAVSTFKASGRAQSLKASAF